MSFCHSHISYSHCVLWIVVGLVSVLFCKLLDIMSFKDYENGLLNTFSVSKFYKSWLIFYRCGLVDVEVRGKIKFGLL